LVKTKHELNHSYLSATPESCLVNFLKQPLGLAWIKVNLCSISQLFNLLYYSKNRLRLLLEEQEVKQEDHSVSNCENVADNKGNLEGKKKCHWGTIPSVAKSTYLEVKYRRCSEEK